LVNGFGEVYGILGDAKTGFRAGRQEIFFGNNLQVRANVSSAVTRSPGGMFMDLRSSANANDTKAIEQAAMAAGST